MKRIVILPILFFLFVFTFCRVDPKIIPALPADNLQETVPPGFPQPIYKFNNNPVTKNTFILGRNLFYETMLSKDNTISCGSCHQNFVAFANSDHRVSHGIDGILGKRNSPALFNLAWAPYFMHDGAIPNIELQPIAPILNPIEMGETMAGVIAKLKASPKYVELFKNAYGSDEINSQKIFRSMAQFMSLLYSYNSKYDYYKRGENNVQLNDAELRGYTAFVSKCAACHQEPLFTDYKMRNNGLKIDPTVNDSGKAQITGLPEDLYKFKTPSLRNIAKTAPYMHDGSLKTLEQCIDHYTNGIVNMTNLDPLLKNSGLQISAQEKLDIIAFLNTLTDYKFIGDPRFSDPNAN